MRVSFPHFAGRLEGFNADGQKITGGQGMIIGGQEISPGVVAKARKLIETELPEDMVVRVSPYALNHGDIRSNMQMLADVCLGTAGLEASALYSSSPVSVINKRNIEDGFRTLIDDAIEVGRKLDAKA